MDNYLVCWVENGKWAQKGFDKEAEARAYLAARQAENKKVILYIAERWVA